MAWGNRWKLISLADRCVFGYGKDGKTCTYAGLIGLGLYLTILPIFVNGVEAHSLVTSGSDNPIPNGISSLIGESKPTSIPVVLLRPKRQAPLSGQPSEVQEKVNDEIPKLGSLISTSNASSNLKKSSGTLSKTSDAVSQDQEPINGNVRVANDSVLPSMENNPAKAKLSNESKEPVDFDYTELNGPKGLSPDAVLRLFYVFVGVGAIILVYILIKLLRLRRKRALRKYRVLAHSDDQEMFPLAADDGDDEEIFNAADHQTLK